MGRFRRNPPKSPNGSVVGSVEPTVQGIKRDYDGIIVENEPTYSESISRNLTEETTHKYQRALDYWVELDINLHVYINQEGQQGYILEITERFTKANPDTDQNTTRIAMLNHEQLYRDPVAFFLALAIADNAFKGIHSLEQFWAVRPQRGQKSFQFKWNQEALDQPVFRTVKKDGRVSDAWAASSMYHLLKRLVANAGFPEGSITMHTFRRGVANMVD
ncbi:MAG: hypothetical protein Q9214_005369, partial [Letrouitia sp. 1 TL-2023]